VLLVVLLALVAVVAAWAAWTLATQGQSGRGQVGTLTNPTVSNAAGAPAGIDCYPGQSCAVEIVVNNPNSTALVLTRYYTNGGTPQVDKPIGTSNLASCPASNFTFNDRTGLTIQIPTGTTTVTVPGAYTLSSSAPNACQGSTVYFTSVSAANYEWATP